MTVRTRAKTDSVASRTFSMPTMGTAANFFCSSRRRHTRYTGDWSADVCSSDLDQRAGGGWNVHATTGPLVGISDPLRNQTVAANGKRAWFGWPDVPKIEELRQQFARTSNPAEAKKIAEEIQKLVIDEGVVVPMGQFVLPTAYSTNLTGVLDSPVAFFWNIK